MNKVTFLFISLCLLFLGTFVSTTYAVDWYFDYSGDKITLNSDERNRYYFYCDSTCGTLGFDVENDFYQNKTITWRLKNPSGTVKASGTMCGGCYGLIPDDGFVTNVTGWWYLEVDAVSPSQYYKVWVYYWIPELDTDDRLDFPMTEGGPNPPSKTIEIYNDGPNTTDICSWSATKSGPMSSRITSFTPSSGSGEGEIDVTVNGSGLSASGSPYYLGKITVTAPGCLYSPQDTEIYLTVGYPNRDLSVQSTPITGILISGTPSGPTNYSSARTHNSQVNLTAPATHVAGGIDYEFIRWRKNGADQGSNRNIVFNITANTTCLTEYQIVKRTLNIQSTPVSGVNITGTSSDGTTVSGPTPRNGLSINDNSDISLTAPPTYTVGNTDYHFVRWTVNGSSQGDGVRAITINDINQTTTAIAVYDIDEHMLTVQANPGNLHVNISGTPAGSTTYYSSRNDNSSVHLEAPSTWHEYNTNYDFVRWSLSTTGDQPLGQTTLDFSINSAVTAEAVYVIGKWDLSTSSTSGGSVTTPGEAGPYEYDDNTYAQIIATAEIGYEFAEWMGTGVDAGKVSDPYSDNTTILMDADYSVHAKFAPGPRDVLYVDDDASGYNDGTSWQDAFEDLQDALEKASISGGITHTIKVAQGIYKPDKGTGDRTASFVLLSGVEILGGFGGVTEANPDDREMHYLSVLSGDIGVPQDIGDNSYHVVAGSGTNRSAVLDGFVISGGNANGGTGFREGGGICNNAGSPTISYCLIEDNTALNGGGIYNNSGSVPLLINCIICHNNASTLGGGICNLVNSDAELVNCTVCSNSAGTSGGGMYSAASNPSVKNSILWDNSDSGGSDETGQIHTDSGTAHIDFSCVQGLAGSLGGLGNIAEDPKFVNPSNRDYHLKSEGWHWDTVGQSWNYDRFDTSRCIDAGNPGMQLYDELMPGDVDPVHPEYSMNVRINMGAYGGTWQASLAIPDWAILSDVTNDGIVNLKDYSVLSSIWQNTGSDMPCDFNRNEHVNFGDLTALCDKWLEITIWY